VYAIQVENVSKNFHLKRRYKQAETMKSALIHWLKGRRITQKSRFFQALHDVSFDVPKGTTLGIIGSNGSGKSTLLKLMAGIHRPTAGAIKTDGRISALIELGAGFHPEFTGRENIYINGIILGLSRKDIQQRIDDIIRFSELEEFIDSPVKTYSSGMYMRLAFSIAAAVDPEILLIDEILAVGDASFQRKCQNRLNALKADGKTIVIVTHDLGALERHCDRVLWLEHGRLKAYGDVQSVVQMYLEHVTEQQRVNLLEEHEDETEESSSRKRRWGSREVEIHSVNFFNGMPEPTYLFKTGDKMSIEILYKAYRPVYSPVFGIGIFRDDETYCYGTNTHIEKINVPRIEGEGTVRFCIDHLDLTSGKYFVDVAIHLEDGTPFDYHTRTYSFEVTSMIHDLGVYRPHHRWEFD